MNVSNGLVKSLLCGVAALVITSSVSYSMVVSSNSLPIGFGADVSRPTVARMMVTPLHAWFGQPAPAVLVD
ncbi:MAG TPA: hypothetical protein VGM84_01115 [Steroidobacteraceae bacterium]